MGVGEGGVGAGDCGVERAIVVNVGSAPVPRTQASGGVQSRAGTKTVFPPASQKLLAAFTMAMRRLFKPFVKKLCPEMYCVAKAATGEQAVEAPPFNIVRPAINAG